MKEVLKKSWPYIVGAIAGGIGGYLYWRYMGCGSSGTCSIGSSSVMGTVGGAIFGALILSMIFPDKKPDKNKKL